QKGMALYFERHDGDAVTTEDFVAAMADANGFDFSQFKRWYAQSGTPIVKVEESFDAAKGEYKIMLRQSCPATPGQDTKEPYHFPLALGLLDQSGKELALKLTHSTHPQKQLNRGIIEMREANEEFVFGGLKSKPVLSINRNFSAPVKLEMSSS